MVNSRSWWRKFILNRIIQPAPSASQGGEAAQRQKRQDGRFRDGGEVHPEWEESAVGGESPVGDQAVDVGMEVHELAERLDGGDAAGCGFLAEQRAVGLED